jgi:hypothetical protein
MRRRTWHGSAWRSCYVLTLAFSCCRKRERSGHCRQLAARQCWAS